MGRFRPGDRYDREGRRDYEITGNIGEDHSFDNIGLNDFSCPFSSQSIKTILGLNAKYNLTDSYHHIRTLIKNSPGYGDYLYFDDSTNQIIIKGNVLQLPDDLVDHTDVNGKIYYLDNDFKGIWGYQCVFPNCPHKIITGRNYFYV